MKISDTRIDSTLLLTRVVLGGVMFAHGAQKLLGWFGGYGFNGSMGFLTGMVHLPVFLAFLVIVAEFFGSLGLISGTLSRLSAFGVIAVMIGAVVTTHLPNGFFMNWSGAQHGEGFEYHILATALALPVLLFGAGAYSIDALIAKWWKSSRESVGQRAVTA